MNFKPIKRMDEAELKDLEDEIEKNELDYEELEAIKKIIESRKKELVYETKVSKIKNSDKLELEEKKVQEIKKLLANNKLSRTDLYEIKDLIEDGIDKFINTRFLRCIEGHFCRSAGKVVHHNNWGHRENYITFKDIFTGESLGEYLIAEYGHKNYSSIDLRDILEKEGIPYENFMRIEELAKIREEYKDVLTKPQKAIIKKL